VPFASDVAPEVAAVGDGAAGDGAAVEGAVWEGAVWEGDVVERAEADDDVPSADLRAVDSVSLLAVTRPFSRVRDAQCHSTRGTADIACHRLGAGRP
jgi:hypothetical protein